MSHRGTQRGQIAARRQLTLMQREPRRFVTIIPSPQSLTAGEQEVVDAGGSWPVRGGEIASYASVESFLATFSVTAIAPPGAAPGIDGLLTVAEVAEILGVRSRATVSAIPASELPYIAVGRGDVREARRYARADVEAFLARRRSRSLTRANSLDAAEEVVEAPAPRPGRLPKPKPRAKPMAPPALDAWLRLKGSRA